MKRLWTPKAEDAVRKYLVTYTNQDGINDAAVQFPDVGTMYRLDFEKFDPLQGFNFLVAKGYLARPQHPLPPKTQCVSMLGSISAEAQKNGNTSGEIGMADYHVFQYPVRVEFCSKDSDTWVPGPVIDGLQVFDDGTIYFPHFFSSRLSWEFTPPDFTDSDGDGMVDMTFKDIRLTVAIPILNRVQCAAQIGAKGGATGKMILANTVNSPDASKLHGNFKALNFIDTNLYHLWQRKDSYAKLPQSALGEALPDKVGLGVDALRDDTEAALAHAGKAQLHVGVLSKSGIGTIDGFLTTEYKVGQKIKKIGSTKCSAVIYGIRWTVVDDKCKTELLWG